MRYRYQHSHMRRMEYVPEFPWERIAVDEMKRQVAEIPGVRHNERILEYLESCTDLGHWARGRDETPWCSAFVNWCVEQSDYAGTNRAWARSWLKWGTGIAVPTPGCIVVLKRGFGGGHVGFYRSLATPTRINILGGNQRNRICVQSYPVSRVLGYRV